MNSVSNTETTETNALREPNLVIIGAQKSGTTSLYHCLKFHPEIFMTSPVKEPGYFMKPAFVINLFRRINHPVSSREEALERYMLKDYKPARYFGDASAYYTFADFARDHRVPARMKKTDPKIKIIYILRNPFARIVSSYLHSLRAGYVKGDFSNFLATPHYDRSVLTSRYWYQLLAYLKHFPKEQIKIVLFEELVEDYPGVIASILQFLELESAGEMRLQIHNRSENRDVLTAADLLFPGDTFEAARRVIEPEVRRLEDFMRRGLDGWDLSAERWSGLPQHQQVAEFPSRESLA